MNTNLNSNFVIPMAIVNGIRVGLSVIRCPVNIFQENTKYFSKELVLICRIIYRGVFMRCRIGELIEVKGMKKKYIAKEIGITPNQLSNWLAMKSYPPLDKAYKLADLLNCKVDDLYERLEETD